MKPNEMLDVALHIAVTSHKGQFDKGGKPYILHPLAVMGLLNTTDYELMCIALLHDVVEDCGITYHGLKEAGMSDRVIMGIMCLTKSIGETYYEYKAKVMSNVDAIKVKMVDLQHNSDITRLKGVTEKDITRMVKYHNFYLELKELITK